MITYHLRSSHQIETPKVVQWAIDGYAIEADRKYLRSIFRKAWDVPAKAADALLSGRAPYSIEPDGAVKFTINENQRLKEKYGS